MDVTVRDWAVLILAIMGVWMAEFMNTAIETVVDMIMPDHHPLAKAANSSSACGEMYSACSGGAQAGTRSTH